MIVDVLLKLCLMNLCLPPVARSVLRNVITALSAGLDAKAGAIVSVAAPAVTVGVAVRVYTFSIPAIVKCIALLWYRV
jgi:hypothetical protein